MFVLTNTPKILIK